MSTAAAKHENPSLHIYLRFAYFLPSYTVGSGSCPVCLYANLPYPFRCTAVATRVVVPIPIYMCNQWSINLNGAPTCVVSSRDHSYMRGIPMQLINGHTQPFILLLQLSVPVMYFLIAVVVVLVHVLLLNKRTINKICFQLQSY